MKAEDKGTKQEIKFKAKPEDADRCIWKFEDGDGRSRRMRKTDEKYRRRRHEMKKERCIWNIKTKLVDVCGR